MTYPNGIRRAWDTLQRQLSIYTIMLKFLTILLRMMRLNALNYYSTVVVNRNIILSCFINGQKYTDRNCCKMIGNQNFRIDNRCYLLVCPLAFCCNIYFWFSFSFFFWRLAERKQTLCILLMLNCKEKKRKEKERPSKGPGTWVENVIIHLCCRKNISKGI